MAEKGFYGMPQLDRIALEQLEAFTCELSQEIQILSIPIPLVAGDIVHSMKIMPWLVIAPDKL